MSSNNNGFGQGLLIYAACAAVAWYFWPQIKAALGPDLTPYGGGYQQPAGRQGPPNNHSGVTPWDPFNLRNRVWGMRLDPTATSDSVEDRRGQRGDIRIPAPQPDGEDDPGPMARADAMQTPDGRRCRENATGRDVPVAICDRAYGRR